MADKKTLLELASKQFGTYSPGLGLLVVIPGAELTFLDVGDRIECRHLASPHDLVATLPPGGQTVGAICRFISDCIEGITRAGERPPAKLKGTGDGGFEDLLMKSAARLEKEGKLTMGRYPVASVIIQGSSRPMQVPSLPDFEGVFPDGRQFVIEAKVCAQGAFEIVKDKLKPKQVKHMLLRHKFGVPGWLIIHFNERAGKTFYDPPFTVALPVKPEVDGGHPVWEKFLAGEKGAYAGSIDRAEARRLGVGVSWTTPPRCKAPLPDIGRLLTGEIIRDQDGNVYTLRR